MRDAPRRSRDSSRDGRRDSRATPTPATTRRRQQATLPPLPAATASTARTSPVSTLSSPLGIGDVAALAGANAKSVSPPRPAWTPGDAAAGREDWVHHLPPLDMHMPLLGLGATEAAWEAHAQPPGAQGQGQGHDSSTFLGWIIGDDVAMPMDDEVLVHDDLDHHMHIPSSVLPPLQFQQPHGVGVVHHTNTSFSPLVTPPKQQLHHPNANPVAVAPPPSPPKHAHAQSRPLAAAGHGLLKPKPEPDDAAAATAVDQLAEAARLAEAGDVLGAREILARLNCLIPPAHTSGKTPLLRAAFYFKEALRAALSTTSTTTASSTSSPVDVLVKLGAYKAFSELCPVLQFAHFTCVQAVLDELGGAACIHVLDFDIGVGEQWASLMQELCRRRRPGGATTLKVTALLSSHHHPLELQLVHENLSNLAAETRVPFQLAFFSLDSTDPAEAELKLLAMAAAGDAVAVHLPAGSVRAAAVPSVLRLVRRLGAKLVVSVDRSCDRGDLPFAAHLFQALQSCVFLLDSLDAVGTAADVAAKIESFLIQPRIDRCVADRYRYRYRAAATPPAWRAMLASAGLVPVQASTFAEAQAETLLNKVPVRGFRVEKRAGSLVLHWQRGELLSVSAWRC